MAKKRKRNHQKEIVLTLVISFVPWQAPSTVPCTGAPARAKWEKNVLENGKCIQQCTFLIDLARSSSSRSIQKRVLRKFPGDIFPSEGELELLLFVFAQFHVGKSLLLFPLKRYAIGWWQSGVSQWCHRGYFKLL